MGLNAHRPAYRVTANSQDITDAISQRLVSLRITDKAGNESDSMTITLADHDPANPIALPPVGAELRAWIGYGESAVMMGVYIVDALELTWPPNALKITAKAAPLAESQSGEGSQRPMLQTKKTRSWDAGKTLGDMARKIASEHGLSPSIGSDMAGIVLSHIDQVNESDMNLLTRLARQYDGIAKPAGGALIVARRGASRTASGSASLPTVSITPDMVTSGKMKLAKRDNAGSVVATWRDTDAAQTQEVTAGQGEPVERLRQTYSDKAEAEAAARAALRQAGRGEQTLSLTLPGNTSLMAEGRVALSGTFAAGADGEWLITEVTHNLGSGGYSCQVKGELPSAE